MCLRLSALRGAFVRTSCVCVYNILNRFGSTAPCEVHFLTFYQKRKNLGHSIQKIFSKFGHSYEFRVFSLENIENLVLNLRPASVY